MLRGYILFTKTTGIISQFLASSPLSIHIARAVDFETSSYQGGANGVW
jgi:hypothetical protein